MHKNFSANEYHSWIISKISPHNCLIVAEIEGYYDKLFFETAVKIVSNNEEMLSYSFSNDFCKFILIENKVEVEEIISTDGWQKFGERELEKPFLSGQSLAKIIVVKLNENSVRYIILCFHHIIGDGVSGLQYLLKIISTYNSQKFEMKNMRYRKNPEINNIKLTNTINDSKITTKISSFFLAEPVVESLTQYTKRYNCSLNSYLSSVFLFSMKENFSINEGIDLYYSFNLRKKNFIQAKSSMKYLTSWINFRVENEKIYDFFNLKYYLQDNIREKIRHKQYLMNMKTLLESVKGRENDIAYRESFISKKPTLCISNLGSILYENVDDSKIKINGIHLSVNAQSYMGTSDSFTIQIIIFNGKIFLEVNYPYPLILEKKIIDFLKLFEIVVIRDLKDA